MADVVRVDDCERVGTPVVRREVIEHGLIGWR